MPSAASISSTPRASVSEEMAPPVAESRKALTSLMPSPSRSMPTALPTAWRRPGWASSSLRPRSFSAKETPRASSS